MGAGYLLTCRMAAAHQTPVEIKRVGERLRIPDLGDSSHGETRDQGQAVLIPCKSKKPKRWGGF